MQFDLDKCAEVTFKKGPPVTSKSIFLHINTEIAELQLNKIYKYLRFNETNGINHTMKKEKTRKLCF